MSGQTILESLRVEIAELKRRLGGGCDAAGGDHTVIKQGRYSFCCKCGESLTVTRCNHKPRET